MVAKKIEKYIKCEYCDEKAVLETHTSGVYICEDTDCATSYCESEFNMIDEEDHENYPTAFICPECDEIHDDEDDALECCEEEEDD